VRWLTAFTAAALGCGGSDVDVGFDAGADAAGDGRLTSLEISVGGAPVALEPAFDPETFSYAVDLRLGDGSIQVVATADVAIEIENTSATSGEPQTIAVALGATAIQVAAIDAGGAARIYQIVINRGAGIAERARVGAAAADGGDGFGEAIALSGDTLIVGAPHEASSATGIDGDDADNGAVDAGAAYVFVRDAAGAWQPQAYLKASNAEDGDRFGASVAIDGDLAVVGAPGESSADPVIDGDQTDNAAPGAGAVYVFSRSGATWTQQAYLKADNAGAGDNLGASVAISGATAIAGAPLEDGAANGAASAGAAYVFFDGGGGWEQQATLRASNAESGDLFGGAVSIDGDRAAVGAVAEASAGALSGAAYVFSRSGQSWIEDAFVVASNTTAGDNFGAAVAISGDTLAVGALAEDSQATGVGGDQSDDTINNSGAVYVFVEAGGWTQQAYIKASNTNSGDLLGAAVAISGDVLAVGATAESGGEGGVNGDEEDNGVDDAGAVYLIVRSGTTWSQQAYVKPATPSAGAAFGSSVAVDGDRLAIGAPGETGAAGAGYPFD
jgi:hypothetical protein